MRQRREELGLTLDDVTSAACVPMAYIAALEAGDEKALPEPCYVFGFIRTYCQLLELGPEKYINAYKAATAPKHTFFKFESDNLPRWLSEALTWAAVCGFMAAAWFAYNEVFRPNANVESGRAEAGTIQISVPSPFTDN